MDHKTLTLIFSNNLKELQKPYLSIFDMKVIIIEIYGINMKKNEIFELYSKAMVHDAAASYKKINIASNSKYIDNRDKDNDFGNDTNYVKISDPMTFLVFCQLVEEKHHIYVDTIFKKQFDLYDLNNKGYITRKDMIRIFSQLCPKLICRLDDVMFQSMDPYGIEKITFKVFCDVMKTCPVS